MTAYKIYREELIMANSPEDQIKWLQKTNKTLKLTQKIANLGYWKYVSSEDTTYWSDQMYVIHGLEPDSFLDSSGTLRLIHSCDRKRVVETILASIETQTTLEIDYRIVRPNGEIRYVVQTIEFLFNEDYDAPEIMGVVQDVTENTLLQLQLHKEEQQYKSLFENSPDSVYSFDLDGNFLSCNRVLEETLGYTREELLFRNFEMLVDQSVLHETKGYFMTTKTTLSPQNYETRGITKDGRVLNFNVTLIPIIVNHKLVGIYGIARNTTEAKAMEQSLLEAENKYRGIFEQSIVGVFIAYGTTFILANPRLNAMYGCDTLVGSDVLEKIHPEDRQAAKGQIDSLKIGQSISNLILRGVRYDGSIIVLEVHASRIQHNGKYATIGMVLDITDRRRTEELNQYLAYHDYLTGLPNRRKFEEQLDIQIKGAQGNDHKCAVLLIDMDRFKYVNDTLGHPVGDVLLKQLSKRMESVMRPGQSSYRLGGDEFAVVLTHVDSYFDAVSTAEHIMELVKEPFLIDGYELNITVSIGISQSGNETTTVENLFRNADTALFYAKTQGRDQVQCYTRSLDAQSYKRFTLSNDLRKALVKDELFLEYMPRVQTLTTEIVAVEALIRWKHPEWGIISPAEFIPIAEETGLIVSIGEWVLREACTQNKKWQEMGLPPITVSVNFSVQQLLHKEIMGTIDRILEQTGNPPQYLEIEITESSFIGNEKEVTELIDKLKARNIKVSLDDFGTGYSSLYLLKRLALDTIKVDKSFVEEVLTDPVNKNIIQCILGLAQSLNMNVVAEGVETAEQYSFLREQKCDEIQGYFFCRPVCSMEIERLLSGRRLNNWELNMRKVM